MGDLPWRLYRLCEGARQGGAQAFPRAGRMEVGDPAEAGAGRKEGTWRAVPHHLDHEGACARVQRYRPAGGDREP